MPLQGEEKRHGERDTEGVPCDEEGRDWSGVSLQQHQEQRERHGFSL